MIINQIWFGCAWEVYDLKEDLLNGIYNMYGLDSKPSSILHRTLKPILNKQDLYIEIKQGNYKTI